MERSYVLSLYICIDLISPPFFSPLSKPHILCFSLHLSLPSQDTDTCTDHLPGYVFVRNSGNIELVDNDGVRLWYYNLHNYLWKFFLNFFFICFYIYTFDSLYNLVLCICSIIISIYSHHISLLCSLALSNAILHFHLHLILSIFPYPIPLICSAPSISTLTNFFSGGAPPQWWMP